MGANLSSTFVPDTSKVVLNAPDTFADILLGIIWALVLYTCAMIFSTCLLVDRWKGPTDKNQVGTASVLGAVLLSTAWPVVMLYLMFAD
ncbi:hypothetical protein HRG_004028 [Hirsutella rhossiliensis]|uniref:Yip1 domain-containing protein n=1 Tax=Hirsutella rhossiliensis TaxID=111463 RepID=A0A9P8N7F3_9HYPO|nr:uncharacterized protein HRG_04028 [Hirsutella rhossiliensis]KAH0966012.1 hypothetical protein HRG_04028 [Hirsutella rhossiliensis]